MPISCDPNDLALAATCFSKLSWRQRQEIRVYLLCTLVNGDTPVDCTPDALAAAAACYNKLSSGQLDQIETYLFCQLASGGAVGGNTIYTGDGTISSDRLITGNDKKVVFESVLQFTAETSQSDPSSYGIVEVGKAYTVFKTVNLTNSNYADFETDPDNAYMIAHGGGLTHFITVNGASGITVGNTGNKVGFMGATPVSRVASADQAIATDPASTMALANALRAALIPTGGFGLIKGSA